MARETITHFIWTDIDAEEEAAFNEWYTAEHMPDRVLRIPGFTRGRRFVALSGGPKYLAYYEMASSDVFWSKEYVAMRAEPDLRSRHFVARFRNALRSTSRVVADWDSGEGEYLGIAGMSPPEGAPGPDQKALFGIPPIGLSRIRLSKTDDELVQANFRRMDQASRGSLRPRDRVPDWVVTVEGADCDAVELALNEAREAFGPLAATDAWALMRMVSQCRPGDANQPGDGPMKPGSGPL